MADDVHKQQQGDPRRGVLRRNHGSSSSEPTGLFKIRCLGCGDGVSRGEAGPPARWSQGMN